MAWRTVADCRRVAAHKSPFNQELELKFRRFDVISGRVTSSNNEPELLLELKNGL